MSEKSIIQKDLSGKIESSVAAIKALQAFRDAATYVLRNSPFPDNLDSATAVERIQVARSAVEEAYGTLTAKVPLDQIAELHASKHTALKVEATVRALLHNRRTVPLLDRATADTLSNAVHFLADGQSALRDLIQELQLELSGIMVQHEVPSLDR